MSRLLVSALSPHLILAVECSMDFLLGYVPHQLVGKHVQVLQGIDSNAFLEEAAAAKTAFNGQVALYEASGKARLMDVSCEYLFSISQNMPCCMMTLEHSEAVTLSEALCGSDRPYVLLSSEWPYSIKMVSQLYTVEIDGAAGSLVGQPAQRIKPAETPERLWLQSIREACQGRRAYHREGTCTSGGRAVFLDITFIPVVNFPNGRAEHVLIRLSPTFRFIPADCGFSNASSIAGVPTMAANCSPSVSAPSYVAPASKPRRGRRAVMPVIMDEAYVRRVRRRHLAAARSACKRADAPFGQSSGCAIRSEIVGAAVAAAAAGPAPAAPGSRFILGIQESSSDSESPWSPSAWAADSDAGGRGPWWDAATEAGLLRPAERAAVGGAALGLGPPWERSDPSEPAWAGDEWL